MVHLWKINNSLELDLNVTELLKYDILAKVYQSDTSDGKSLSHKYFMYLDFITASSGYCVTNGLNDSEAHIYAMKHSKLDSTYHFPANNKTIIAFVKSELERDTVFTLVSAAIQALNVSSKSVKNYIKVLNNMEKDDFQDKDGNPINVAETVNKVLKTLKEIPSSIDIYESLLSKQKTKKVALRGQKDFRSSMDGDDDLKSLISK